MPKSRNSKNHKKKVQNFKNRVQRDRNMMKQAIHNQFERIQEGDGNIMSVEAVPNIDGDFSLEETTTQVPDAVQTGGTINPDEVGFDPTGFQI